MKDQATKNYMTNSECEIDVCNRDNTLGKVYFERILRHPGKYNKFIHVGWKTTYVPEEPTTNNHTYQYCYYDTNIESILTEWIHIDYKNRSRVNKINKEVLEYPPSDEEYNY